MKTNTKKDKSDYLSPVLVKELRQGLRSKVFIGWFLMTQLLMIGTVIMGLITVNKGQNIQGYNGMFWTMIGLLLLFVLPGRGVHSISKEVEQNTIELVMLTRLTAWRIVFGKWLSYGSQILLLFSSIVPYFILRYYLGGINLLTEFMIFSVLLILSLLFTSMTIAQSALAGKTKSKRSAGRGAQVVLMILVFYIIIMAVEGMGLFRRMPKVDTDFFIILVSYCPLLITFMLTVGASKIAPLAENYSARKRLIGIAFLFLSTLLLFTDIEKDFIIGCSMLPLLIIWMDAITEDVKMIPSIFQNFLVRGRIAKSLRFLLYPGWYSGLLYFLTTLTGLYLLICINYPDSWNIIVHFVALIGTIIMPLSLATLFRQKKIPVYKIYWIIQVTILVTVVILLALKDEIDSKIIDVIYIIPCAALFTWEKSGLIWHELLMPLSTTLICAFILLPKIKSNIRQVREIESKLEIYKNDTDPVTSKQQIVNSER